MGFYTAFRVDCVVRPEYHAAIAHRTSESQDWGRTRATFPSLPCSDAFFDDERRDFVPDGGNGYMPDCWHKEIPDAGVTRCAGDSKQSFDLRDGRWAFACTLKNYTETIEKFVLGLLFPVAESVALCESEDEYGMKTNYLRRDNDVIVRYITPNRILDEIHKQEEPGAI
jgi:hypothetical protein